MIMGKRRADGRRRMPAMTTPASEPPPKADRMMPNAAAPPANRVSASTGMPTEMGPLMSRLTTAMSPK